MLDSTVGEVTLMGSWDPQTRRSALGSPAPQSRHQVLAVPYPLWFRSTKRFARLASEARRSAASTATTDCSVGATEPTASLATVRSPRRPFRSPCSPGYNSLRWRLGRDTYVQSPDRVTSTAGARMLMASSGTGRLSHGEHLRTFQPVASFGRFRLGEIILALSKTTAQATVGAATNKVSSDSVPLLNHPCLAITPCPPSSREDTHSRPSALVSITA